MPKETWEQIYVGVNKASNEQGCKEGNSRIIRLYLNKMGAWKKKKTYTIPVCFPFTHIITTLKTLPTLDVIAGGVPSHWTIL